jgi:mannose-1-phosphate guanylyltransferase
LNGDIFADLSYRELFDAHMKTNATATIALCKVEDPSRYGVAEMASDNRIKRFIEKPQKDKAPSNLINAGIYVLSPKIFDYIPNRKHVSMEREIFPKLAEEGKLYGHLVNGLWIDIGKPEEYLQANKIVLDSLAKKQKGKQRKNLQLKNPTALDKGVAIGENSVIGPYAIVGKKVDIGKNVQVRNSIIFSHAIIDDFSIVNGAIIGEEAHVGKHVTLGRGCIIGDHAKIKDNLHLPENASVCPAKEVVENVIKSSVNV